MSTAPAEHLDRAGRAHQAAGWGASGAQSLLSEPDTLLRTVPYTAPDVSQGRSPTASGDLYALGVTLYEMLTGDLPYGGDGLIQVVLRHAQEPIPSPRALNPGVPSALEGVVRKALGKRPEERYGSASEMLADLRAIRDALRYGKSLSWSPLDRSTQDESKTVVGPKPAGGGEATIVMPTPSGREEPAPRGAAPAAREPRESRWLSSLNLFMLALVLVGAAALAWMTLNFMKAPGDVIVPNLVGRTAGEAEALARGQKFTLVQVDAQYRDKEPEGVIYRMQPEPGSSIREGKPVRIWVSKGPQLVEVPDVTDTSVEKAKQVIEGQGLRLGKKEWEHDPLIAKGNVLRQAPQSAERRPRGSPVDVVLSAGEEPPPEPVEPVDGGGEGSFSGGMAEGTPPEDVGAGDTGDGERIRVFTVRYRVPGDNATHRIRIDVTDKDGQRTVYDEVREAGERVEEEIEGVGKRITIKLYDNDELRSEQSK